MGGDGKTFLKKKVRTSLCNKKISRMDHKKKKARVGHPEAEKGKSRKIERAREIERRGISVLEYNRYL